MPTFSVSSLYRMSLISEEDSKGVEAGVVTGLVAYLNLVEETHRSSINSQICIICNHNVSLTLTVPRHNLFFIRQISQYR